MIKVPQDTALSQPSSKSRRWQCETSVTPRILSDLIISTRSYRFLSSRA